jgi:hypothetical protein
MPPFFSSSRQVDHERKYGMKCYRMLLTITFTFFFLGIPLILSAAEPRITFLRVAFDFKAREMNAPSNFVKTAANA